MSATSGFKFAGYELRPATEEDIDLARAWTAADPAHAGIIAPGFWLEQEPGVDCYLLSDASGPLFFFRMQRAVRLLIQFSPEADAERTRKGLEEGVAWLERGLAMVAVTEILFDSCATLLRRMVTGKLRFTPKRDTLSRFVPRVIRRPLQPVFIPGMDFTADAAQTPLHGELRPLESGE